MWVELVSDCLKLSNIILIVTLAAIDHTKVVLIEPSSIVNAISTTC